MHQQTHKGTYATGFVGTFGTRRRLFFDGLSTASASTGLSTTSSSLARLVGAAEEEPLVSQLASESERSITSTGWPATDTSRGSSGLPRAVGPACPCTPPAGTDCLPGPTGSWDPSPRVGGASSSPSPPSATTSSPSIAEFRIDLEWSGKNSGPSGPSSIAWIRKSCTHRQARISRVDPVDNNKQKRPRNIPGEADTCGCKAPDRTASPRRRAPW